MIWHIFKKDWKLLWKFAALMALVQFTSAAVLIKLTPFGDSRPLLSLLQLLLMITMAGIPFLIAAVVHNDAIPGVRQDWLVRPIQRRDLLLAKFLFVVVAVHGPMLLADLCRGLANGFPLSASLGAALSRGLFMLLALSVPLFAFASLTKNTMEAIAAALVVFLMFAGGTLFLDQFSRHIFVGGSGLGWILEASLGLVSLIGATAVLGLQYFRRRTLLARGLATGAFVLVVALNVSIPWSPAFAMQQRFSPNPGAGSAVGVSFDPSMGPFHPFTASGELFGNEERALVFLPLRFENLPAGSALISDHAELKWKQPGGVITSVGFSYAVSVRQEAIVENPAAHLQVLIPAALYRQIQDHPEQLELELSLTLLRSAGLHSIPALNGKVRFPDLGTCSTRVNAAETAVRLACVPLEEAPSCFRMVLQHVPSGRSNAQFQCQGDYSPFYDAVFVMPPPIRSLAFRDLSGLAKFPVDGSMLNESQVVLETYQPVDHFTRTVSIPNTRLQDWTARQ